MVTRCSPSENFDSFSKVFIDVLNQLRKKISLWVKLLFHCWPSGGSRRWPEHLHTQFYVPNLLMYVHHEDVIISIYLFALSYMLIVYCHTVVCRVSCDPATQWELQSSKHSGKCGFYWADLTFPLRILLPDWCRWRLYVLFHCVSLTLSVRPTNKL